jgi:type IV secretion system protein VirB5
MTTTSLVVPITKDYGAARREFVELYGSTAVMNTYLKIAVLCLCLTNIGLTVLLTKTYKHFENVKPWIIRINEVGRAEAVSFDSFEYHPQEAEFKYFLIQFVQRYYSRIRATVERDYARSLYFLERQLVDSVVEANKKSKAIESFLAGQGGEIDIKVTNVSIEDLRTPPYHATVDFEKIYYGAGHQESRREKYVANFVFVVKDRVPNNFIPINPLGLTITYFREDQTFER